MAQQNARPRRFDRAWAGSAGGGRGELGNLANAQNEAFTLLEGRQPPNQTRDLYLLAELHLASWPRHPTTSALPMTL